jgi:hypothetical protein
VVNSFVIGIKGISVVSFVIAEMGNNCPFVEHLG